MTPEKLFEEKEHLVFAAIKQQFGSYTYAKKIAEKNNMVFDDLVQIGRIKLWELCLEYDPEKASTFNSYVMMTLKWKISEEVHIKGLTIKVPRSVNYEERNELCFHSIDLYKEDDTESDFFAISPINVEEEVIIGIQVQEIMKVLNEEERFILKKKSLGFTDKEIGRHFGRGRNYVSKIET
ncbi:sigma-70 family RNA polymerase sigma factor, partial [Bacillus wiedmannii]|uniref:sigma-70 family RNA polymerase sigma factor n=1 Tax=Bacillus wiedmannii TaxID=1890302 RepID=UPI001155F10E